jgi:hypothetical protein
VPTAAAKRHNLTAIMQSARVSLQLQRGILFLGPQSVWASLLGQGCALQQAALSAAQAAVTSLQQQQHFGSFQAQPCSSSGNNGSSWDNSSVYNINLHSHAQGWAAASGHAAATGWVSRSNSPCSRSRPSLRLDGSIASVYYHCMQCLPCVLHVTLALAMHSQGDCTN